VLRLVLKEEETGMSKTIVAISLAGLVAAFLVAQPASAAPVIPFSQSAIAALGGDVVDVGWRRCWRDRWGRRVCHWCWRDRWGRVNCR
jgi:hypothetical protein